MVRAIDELERRFAPVARALRDGIIEHYHDRGESLDSVAGRRTLDTNSILAPERAILLMRILERRGGPTSLEGLRVADLGCGFGSLSLVFAVAGASVVGVDPNIDRASVSGAIAHHLGLDAQFRRGWAEDLVLDDESVDLVVLNNSLCYVTGRSERRRALRHAWRVLGRGGWALLRNPSRMAPVDPFTGLPLVHQLPPSLARRLVARRTPRRSDVRLVTGGGAVRELKRAGFSDVRVERIDQPWWRPPRYQHHSGRKTE